MACGSTGVGLMRRRQKGIKWENQPSGTNAERIRRNMWMIGRSAQRNEHIRMQQLRLSGSGIKHDLTPELGKRRRADWGAYKSIEDVVKKTRNTLFRAHLFNTTVLPALTYAS
ncbi:hypothetical protein RB195_017476 [Necator americanus]|uniref:Uncharacterized protein n=1 Tax=Necator americanus TaxID=51031 RepID=A0ABR1C5E6_NECAM